jgi:RHS repeat-associated protein
VPHFTVLSDSCAARVSTIQCTVGPRTISTPVLLLFKFCCLLGVAFSLGLNARGQAVYDGNQNLPPYGGFSGGDFDTVSLQNGNLHLHIPIGSWQQRGGKTVWLALVSDSAMWSRVTTVTVQNGTSYYFTHFTGSVLPGLSENSNNGSWAVTSAISSEYCPGPNYNVNLYDTFNLTDPEGVQHPVDIATSACPGAGPNVTQGPTQDGSGIMVNIGSNPAITLKDGTVLPLQGSNAFFTALGSKEDTNGNLIGATDTIGRTLWTTTYGPTTTLTTPLGAQVQNPQYALVTVTDTSGTARSYRIDYAAIDVVTSFCGSYNNPPYWTCNEPNTTYVVPSKLTLPNEAVYQFSWIDSTPAELGSITLPTGGSITYGYASGCIQPPYSLLRYPPASCSAEVTSRTVTVNGTESVWTYKGGTVTDPLGNQQVHFFSQVVVNNIRSAGTVESQVCYYQGSATSGKLLKQVVTNYTGEPGFQFTGTQFLANIRPISATTTLDNGLVSQTQTDYETFTFNGLTWTRTNPTEVREYDYGNGAPGALLRRTDYTYLHNSNSTYGNLNIVDRVTQKTVFDGNNKQVSQTTYEYDNYGHSKQPMQPSNAVQHDSNFSTTYITRGNVTAVSQWNNATGSLLTTTKQYDDAGNVLSTIDPLNNTTSFGFTDSWSNATCAPSGQGKAYLTTSTNAKNQVTSYTYDSCTGLQASTTDPNLQPTSASYDMFGRVTGVSYPDGGSISYCYTDVGGAKCTQSAPPYSEVITQPITSSVTKTSTIAFDGLGRVSQTQLNSDPSGVAYTAITYDLLGRKSQVYNPTRCSPPTTNCGTETTWGYATTNYDALNRVTSVVEQDGSVVSMTYDQTTAKSTGTCTTVTDEASHQRTTCSDGLGRLVEADEPGVGGGAGTPGTGSVSISGSEQGPVNACPPNTCWIYDSGGVTVTVNGVTVGGAGFSSLSDTSSSIATALAEAINNNSSSPVSASASGGEVLLTSTTTGSTTNYSLSVSMNHNTQFFANPSFTITPSGSSLTGGSGTGSGSILVTLYNYDALDNLTCVEQHGGVSGTGCSSPPSNDASSPWRVRRFSYDSLSRLLTAQNPETGGLAGQISYAYDGDSNLVSKTSLSPNQGTTGTQQVTINYAYDPLNRLQGKSYADGYSSNNGYTSAVVYGYDGVAPTGCTPPSLTDKYPIGQRTSMCDGSGETSWLHDQMGRVKEERRTIGAANGKYTYYTYNKDGSLATLQTPPEKTVSYTIGGAGLPTNAVDSNDGINFVTNATYAPPGELQSLTNGGVIYGALAYNSRLQPMQLFYGTNTPPLLTQMTAGCPSTVGNIMNKTYNFSAGAGDNGNVLSIANCRDTTRTQSFTYDGLNRISSAQSSGTQWGETFTIDPWGNLYSRGGISGKTYSEPLPYSSTNQNQLSPGFGYDPAGNMTSNQGILLVYDDENRLIWTPQYRYVYDGDGNRVEKCAAVSAATLCPTSGTSGTLYWRSTSGDTLDESDLAGNPQEEYIFFNGQRIARRDVTSGGATIAVHYYFSDHLGSHSVIENATGTACEQDIDYYPYGGQENDYCPNVAQHYKFTGKERDTESGLDDFEARYVGSSLGRFMSADLLAGHPQDPQTLNRYAYVANNPLSRTDPSGLDWYLGCISSNHSGCLQINDKDKTWVQADTNGNAIIVTSDSIRNGDNSATVDKNGVEITTGGNTYQGVYFDNPASHTTDANGNDVNYNPITLQGDASKGFGGFTFNFNGNCSGTCLSSGSFQFAGTSDEARAALTAAGAWDYGFWDVFDSSDLPFVGHHPQSDQFRFGSGPSPHFSVPIDYLFPPNVGKWMAIRNPKSTVPATGDFHVDATVGTSHGLCANLGIGCSK